MDEAAQPIESTKIYDLLNWAHTNRRTITLVVGITAGLGIAVALMSWRRSENELAANRTLFATPGIVVAAATTQPAKAETLLKIASDYQGTAAGNRAELLGSTRLFSEGKFAEAFAGFDQLATAAGNPSLRATATYGAAACLDAQGKRSEALARYQEVVSQFPDEPVAPQAKLALGRIHEAEGRHEAAFRLYQELGAAGPYDPWSAEANERRQELLAQFPDLAKNIPAVAPLALPGMAPEAAPGAAPKL
jgi:tetratricopeptide (TPR) repeat protein